MTLLPDQSARQAALDPTHSFIVQAPAGSGKTGLLIQRYLVLLAGVQAPEEIVAITFTRKAAAEMRGRVVAALERATSAVPPEVEHERTTWELARAAVERDALLGWKIRENPARLRISTIDALCAALTRRMPVLSGFGMQPETTEKAAPFYAEAAAETLAELESGAVWSDSVEALIRHLDNHVGRVERLIAEMLPRRDQWLRHVIDTTDPRVQRAALENALCDVIVSALEDARRIMPPDAAADIPEFARFAAGNLFGTAPGSPVCACLGLEGFPRCVPEELQGWLGIAELLLTKEGHVRKAADKRLGFPPAPDANAPPGATKTLYQERKAAFKELLSSLEGHDALAEALHAIRLLPAPYYTEYQWDLTEALFEILKLAVAHLQVAFQKHNRVDFTEVALRAGTALGGPDDPTDLALALDYGISHILIDEFQDTSISQFELLRKLTGGWTPGDGRTFFGVGDPMQSIYGFREAEVGLFLRAWAEGLGPHLPLAPLTLSANFRSMKNIVDWVNRTFIQILPQKPDAVAGAVAYTASDAVLPLIPDPAVTMHPIINGSEGVDEGAVPERVIACIRKARDADPDGKIAVLVRSRPHLYGIISRLRDEYIPYKAVEIDSLGGRPVIGDLLSLTRALSHPADRIAWLAVLRAPWCGLTLHDLFVLAGDDHEAAIPELIGHEERVAALSEDGRARLERFRGMMDTIMANLRRRSLRRRVESAWTALGGPACVRGPADLEDAAAFFDLLDREIGSGEMTDYTALESAAGALFARPDPDAGDTLQIMTIHKAKGLEFDTVIIPGLEKYPPPDPPRLLLWQERPGAAPDKGLLLAPIAEAGTGEDPTYRYIRILQERKRDYEAGRLLYVAATRAKKRLHLIGRISRNGEGEMKPPDRRSLLSSLWPAVEDIFNAANAAAGKPAGPVEPEAEPGTPEILIPYYLRLNGRWQQPPVPEGIPLAAGGAEQSGASQEIDMLRFDWAGETVRRIGTVIHRWLRVIGEKGAGEWSDEHVAALDPVIRTDLAGIGLGKPKIGDAAVQVMTALKSTLADPRGKWILSRHKESRCEYALTGRIEGAIAHAVIDRTFIDESGTRWVIDYKSGVHRGGGLAEFLEKERLRYAVRMANYARLLRERDPGRPVRLGLYFPRFSGWCEWEG